jgi:hypothetical protein
MSDERMKGVADAIRVIKAMGHEWPDAIGSEHVGKFGMHYARSERDDYGTQFVRRILQQFPEAERCVPFGQRT